MLVALIIVFAALVAIGIVAWRKRKNIERELERYSVSPQELHTFIASGQKLAIFDVRQALDLLAYPEKIPGAERVPPEEVLAKPDIIPRDQDVVVYCTCPTGHYSEGSGCCCLLHVPKREDQPQGLASRTDARILAGEIPDGRLGGLESHGFPRRAVSRVINFPAPRGRDAQGVTKSTVRSRCRGG
jgi:hypothetical protein